MLLVWLAAAIVLLVAAYHMLPRRERNVQTLSPEDEAMIRRKQFELLLKEEKDTKRYWNDIRSLYPL